MTRLLAPWLLVLGLAACEGSADCGACPPALELDVSLEGPDALPTVSGAPVSCTPAGPQRAVCTAQELPPGSYALTVTAPQHHAVEVAFTLGGPLESRFCTCPDHHRADVVLRADTSCGECAGCPPAVMLDVALAGGDQGPVQVAPADPEHASNTVSCWPEGESAYRCQGGTWELDGQVLVVSAPGHAPQEVVVSLGELPPGCCACRDSHRQSLTLEVETPDAGSPDAGSPDAGA